MRKTSFLMLLVSATLAFSCQQKPYASFQKIPLATEISTEKLVQSDIKPLEISQPTSLSAENTPFAPLEIVESITYSNTPVEKVKEKRTVFAQYRKIIAAKKTLKQLTRTQSKTAKSVADYKAMGVTSTILGLIATACVVLSIFTLIGLGAGFIIAGILGLIAFILGVSSVGKLKGEQKLPSILGIIGGAIGLAFGIFLLIFILAWTLG